MDTQTKHIQTKHEINFVNKDIFLWEWEWRKKKRIWRKLVANGDGLCANMDIIDHLYANIYIDIYIIYNWENEPLPWTNVDDQKSGETQATVDLDRVATAVLNSTRTPNSPFGSVRSLCVCIYRWRQWQMINHRTANGRRLLPDCADCCGAREREGERESVGASHFDELLKGERAATSPHSLVLRWCSVDCFSYCCIQIVDDCSFMPP